MESAEDPLMNKTANGDVVGLTSHKLDELEYISAVRDAAAGAISVFVGTTRDSFEGKTVTKLEYEAYHGMALKSMVQICREARQMTIDGDFSFDWPAIPQKHTTTSALLPIGTIAQVHSQKTPIHARRLERIVIVHRLGIVPPTESSIVIAVSSPHRREASRATEWILEEVKKRVQVWKREVYAIDSANTIEHSWKANAGRVMMWFSRSNHAAFSEPA